MAFSVTLYTFRKRNNSTARPTDGPEFSGVLRDPCGVINPTIGFEFPAGVNPSAFNYAYIPTFGRYYFINEWTAAGRLWVASMSVDALASWADDIADENLYVLRSSYRRNERIPDTLYPTISRPTFQSEYKSFESWNYSFSAGSYVVGIVNDSSSGVGAATYYGFTNSQFREFMNHLLSDVDWLNPESITEIGEGLLKALFNPMQYIASCMWFPFPVSGTAVSSIPVGWNWSINASAIRLSGSMLYGEFMSFNVPKHPQATALSYLNSAPFSQYNLLASPFGNFPLDASLLASSGVIDVSVDVDVVSGLGRLTVAGAAGIRMIDSCAQIGCPIQLSQTTLNVSKGGSALAGAVGAIASASMAGRIASGLSGIASALDFATNPTFTSTGANGSIAGIGPFGLTATFFSQSEKNNGEFGSPLCENVRLGTIPGYIMIENPSVDIACTDTERKLIENHMASGFFLEGDD